MAITLSRDIVRTIRTCAPDVSPHALPTHLTNIYKPGVQLNNLAFENGIHRKLHVSTAHQSMIRIVHTTLYPRPRFDAPIVSVDFVSVGAQPTFAMVDTFPVTDDLHLPEQYQDAVVDLQSRFGVQAVHRSALPTWGKEICSDRVVMVDRPFDSNAMCEYILALCAMHLDYCAGLEASRDYRRIRMNHLRFCRGQLKNTRIRTALASSFCGDLIHANEYMNKVFFDC
jgi:hypothetical protein